ncbi:hypothetical protein ACA081_00090 [Candidatus Hodgkinia cicadicola]
MELSFIAASAVHSILNIYGGRYNYVSIQTWPPGQWKQVNSIKADLSASSYLSVGKRQPPKWPRCRIWWVVCFLLVVK